MALDENVTGLLSLTASGDLSAKQYYAVKIDTNGKIAVAGAGECAIGILYSDPNADGVIASVRPLDGRKAKAIAGGSITKGDRLASDASGKLVTATAAKVDTLSTGIAADPVIGSHVLGVALESASANDIFQFLALPLGAVPTTAA